jgi:phage baseplate assembly protein W
MAQDNPFLGTGWGFPPTFTRATQSVQMTSGEQDIHGSLHILLSTALGERVMQPTYGSRLKDYLFEPMDSSLQAQLKDLIKTAILYFEPRILLEKVSLDATANEGVVTIEIDYRIRGTNSRYNFVLPFYLNEGAQPNP